MFNNNNTCIYPTVHTNYKTKFTKIRENNNENTKKKLIKLSQAQVGIFD